MFMRTIIGIFIVLISSSFVVLPFPTTLRITTLNDLGNVEDSVQVTLYRTLKDYREEVNPVAEPQFSDKKGRTTFKKLDPVKYYIHAEKGDKSNIGGGVETNTLEEGKINKLTIIIE